MAIQAVIMKTTPEKISVKVPARKPIAEMWRISSTRAELIIYYLLGGRGT
jgi:hypothetical protein